jgi:DNA polymerase
MSDAPKSDALAALSWLLDAGADEAIGEEAVNRFAKATPVGEAKGRPSATVSTVTASPKPFSTLPRGETGARSPGFAQTRAAAPMTGAHAPSTDNISHAMEVAAACASLADLKSALENFEGSQLKRNATNTVFADGSPEARIMFVGEAPGYDEDRIGLPFVGRAGKLLDRMLEAIHLDRSSAYIINVLPWRPPDNRNPEATEVAQCIPFLRRHIELAAPRIMILLGAVSLRHVLGLSEGIMKYRGRWMEYRIGEQMVPVMPTLHPAYLLRQPAHKKLAWRDLQAVEEKITTLGLNKDRAARSDAG